MTDEQILRQEALRTASIKYAGDNTPKTPENIIRDAEMYFEFLSKCTLSIPYINPFNNPYNVTYTTGGTLTNVPNGQGL